MWFPIIEQMRKAKEGNTKPENNIKKEDEPKMKYFTIYSEEDNNNSLSEKYYQDANCWYEVDTMKLLKDNVVWNFSKKVKPSKNRHDIFWIYNEKAKNKIEVRGIKLKNSDQQIVYDNDLNRALALFKSTVYCPESDQTIELNRENLLSFCLFLREDEIKKSLQEKEEKEKLIKQKRLEKQENKKRLIREKHMIASAYLEKQLIEEASKELEIMPIELKKDYDNYVKILESIRLSKEENKEEIKWV